MRPLGNFWGIVRIRNVNEDPASLYFSHLKVHSVKLDGTGTVNHVEYYIIRFYIFAIRRHI